MDRAPLQKIYVEGDGRARGLAHGEALRRLVHEHYDRWLDSLGEELQTNPRAYIADFLEQTDFLPAVKKWTPDILEEVHGISEGADLPFQLVFARQLSDEEPWFRRDRKIRWPSHNGCSSIASWADPDGTTYVAQNMDCYQWWDGSQILLHAKDPATGVQVFEFTLAGKISLAGMNSAGLAMCCNTLSQLDSSRTGLPEDFVVRGFLEKISLSDGVDFLKAIEHASGQNYTIGEPAVPAIDLECSARSVTEFRIKSPANCVYHTNHPFTNDDRAMFLERSARMNEEELRLLYNGSSYPRFAAIEAHVNAVDGPIGLVEIKSILSSHDGPVCRHGREAYKNDNFTLGCLIMELGDEPVLHVSSGPPCHTPFQEFRFD